MKARLVIFVLLVSSFSLFGQVQSLVKQGMNEAYNFQFESAEKTFNRVLELRPNSPEGYYRNALIHFWIFLGSRNEGEYQTFLKFADLAQQKADALLSKNPKDIETKYLAANLASFRAMAQATNNQSVDAFWSSKQAVSQFEEIIKANPRYYDAYLGLGLFDYAMSFVPDFLKWAVNLTGLSSDKARGFRYIKTALRKGTTVKTEAAFHLSKVYNDYLAEYDSGYVILQDLTSKYPRNGLFAYQSAVSLIKAKQLDRAISVLDRVISIKNKRVPQITALAYYRRGEIYFKKNQYRTAIRNYKKFLDTSKELDLTGIAALNTALAYKMLGKDEEFKQNLALAKGGNQDLFEDTYAMKKSETFLAHGITPIELKLVRMKNRLDAGDNRTAYDSLKLEIPKIENKETKALAQIYFAEAASNLRKHSEVVSVCDLLADMSLSSEKWIKPFADFLNAKAKFVLGDRTSAKELLEDAEDDNEFEFRDYIQSQIEWLKRRIK
ncbi:MAG: tetratricopeptide repeat protein [Melioribacteraceae bacterium]